jgi:hypothetical protein
MLRTGRLAASGISGAMPKAVTVKPPRPTTAAVTIDRRYRVASCRTVARERSKN